LVAGRGLAHTISWVTEQRSCSAVPTCVGGPGVQRAYECWAGRAGPVSGRSAIDGVTGEVFRARLTPDHEHVLGWVGQLPRPAAVTYEAGPTGFGLARAMSAAGVRCEVAAPSKITRPSGDRVKTDARDALLLARLLRCFARSTTATIRRKLITVPARVASFARRVTLHLPTAWPWETAWTELFTRVCGPPPAPTT
jgi:hypothetical protein